MAARRPTRSLLQEARVIDVSNENVPGYFLLLEMAFQTKRRIPFVEQALIDRAVGRMADHTTLTHCLVLVNPGTPLLGVALKASFVCAEERKATGFELLLNISLPAFDCDALVQLVTISAAHFAFRNGVVMRQLKRRANFQVALEACFRRFSWIDNGTRSAPCFDVQTSGPVARLAAHVRDLFWSSAALCLSAFSAALTYDYLFCLQSRMGGCSKIAHDLFVAGGTFL